MEDIAQFFITIRIIQIFLDKIFENEIPGCTLDKSRSQCSKYRQIVTNRSSRFIEECNIR